MKEAEVKKRLSELRQILSTGPLSERAGPGSPVPRRDEIHPEDARVPEVLDQLRLQVKYLLFDLEATKRENRYLRQMLDARRRGDHGSPPGGAPPAP